MKVYEPLNEKDVKTGLFYRVWEVPEGMPLAQSLIINGPDASLAFPKYDPSKGTWVEDKDSIIEDFKGVIEAMGSDIMDLMELSGGVE